MKRIVAIVLTLSLALPLLGCNKDSEGYEGETADEAIFYATDFIADVAMSYLMDFSIYQNGLILIGTVRDENMSPTVKAIRFDFDGRILSEAALNLPNVDNVFRAIVAAVDANGNIWVLRHETLATEGFFEYQGSYFECFDIEGNHLKTVELEQSQTVITDEVFVLNLIIGDDGLFYTCTGSGYAAVFDGEGMLIYQSESVSGILKMQDGRIIARKISTRLDCNKEVFSEIITKSESFGEQWSIDPSEAFSCYYLSGNAAEILESTRSKLYSHDLETGNKTELIDWARQGVLETDDDIHKYVVISGDIVYRLESQRSGSGPSASLKISIVRINRADIITHEDKTVITLATVSDDSEISRTVVDFNRKNSDCFIQVRTYQKPGQSYNDALSDFNLDMIKGNVPDIVIIDSLMPFSEYVSSGLFVDLYEHFGASSISRADYLPNIMDMLETEGKLYAVAPYFSIDTIIGKASEVGDKPGWTWSEFGALMDSKPEGTVPVGERFNHVSGSEFLSYVLSVNISSYIDPKADKCYFDDPKFITLLETAKRYFSSDGGDRSVREFREGTVLLRDTLSTGFSLTAFKEYELFYFDEPITYVGLPTEDGKSGSFANFNYRTAISSSSESVDAAWKYVLYMLTDYQQEVDDADNVSSIRGFPIKTSALERQVEFAKSPVTEGATYTMTIDNITLSYTPTMTDEESQKVLDLIYSLELSDSNVDSAVRLIVFEESADYFAGLRTAEQAAAIIQNRVSTYLSERN